MVLSLLAAVALALPSRAPTPHGASTIEIAVEDQAALWSRPDGTGYANDVVRSAFKAAGVDVTFRVVPYARCKQMVLNGTVVACFSMSRDPELKGRVIFPSMPIFTCYADLVQNPVRPLPAGRLRDLPRGTVIGTVLGYEYPEAIQQAVSSGAIVLDEAPSEEMLMRKLAAGRLPAALVNVNESKSLEYLSALAHVSNSSSVRVERIGTLPSYLGFSARHAQATWALHKYEEGMRVISANGALARVTRQWTDSSLAAIRAARGGTVRPMSHAPR